MINQGETVLLFGEPKTGMTKFCYNLALAVSSGDTFLGKNFKPGKVLIYQSNESIDATADTLNRMNILSKPQLNIIVSKSRDLYSIAENVSHEKPELLIVDSLTSVNLGNSTRESDRAYAKPLEALAEVVRQNHASCIIIHHASKGSISAGKPKPSGTSALVDAVDRCYSLEHTNRPDQRLLRSYPLDIGYSQLLDFNPDTLLFTQASLL